MQALVNGMSSVRMICLDLLVTLDFEHISYLVTIKFTDETGIKIADKQQVYVICTSRDYGRYEDLSKSCVS